MSDLDLAKGHNLPPRRSHSRVLLEYGKVRQIEGEPFRRWFRSRQMDLTVWYSPEGAISAFQLCYGCDAEERAITWSSATGWAHDDVDQGDPEPGRIKMKMTPILLPDGACDSRKVLGAFMEECQELPYEIVEFVTARLREYPAPSGS